MLMFMFIDEEKEKSEERVSVVFNGAGQGRKRAR